MVEFLTADAQHVPLEQAVSEQDEDDLISYQIEGTGRESLQVGVTFQLTMPLFNGRPQGVVLPAQHRVSHRRGGKQHPIILATIGIDLLVDDDVQGDGTGCKRLNGSHRGHFGTVW